MYQTNIVNCINGKTICFFVINGTVNVCLDKISCFHHNVCNNIIVMNFAICFSMLATKVLIGGHNCIKLDSRNGMLVAECHRKNGVLCQRRAGKNMT